MHHLQVRDIAAIGWDGDRKREADIEEVSGDQREEGRNEGEVGFGAHAERIWLSMDMTVKVEGLSGLLNELQELPKRVTQKAVVRRALTQAAEPIRSLWAALAPYDGSDLGLHLRDSVVVSSKTVSRHGDPGEPPGAVIVYIGPNKILPRHHGIFMEFGTFKDRPQPSGRPAWEARKEESLNLLGYYMWVEIDASAHRLAAKASRLAA